MSKIRIRIVFSFFFASAVCLTSLHASGRSAQELVKSGSWVYDAFAAIAIETGRVDFSDQSPLTINELRIYLEEINYDSLSIAGKAQYRRILDYFEEENFSVGSDIIRASAEPEINAEGYYKTEDVIP